MKPHGPRIAVALTLAVLSTAHGAVRARALAKPSTTDPVEFVTVGVKITDARVVLSRSSAPRGHYGRFVVRNVGKKIHSFTLGKQAALATSLQRGFSVTVRPSRRRILLLYLDYRGKLPYRADVRPSLGRSGAKGIFTIS